ncbi:hypothetical protein ZWY2020_054475 [Hordeum vulgare]|nr:hypothetical protein ZWY2020_054475 [Hordeum vulgare]
MFGLPNSGGRRCGWTIGGRRFGLRPSRPDARRASMSSAVLDRGCSGPASNSSRAWAAVDGDDEESKEGGRGARRCSLLKIVQVVFSVLPLLGLKRFSFQSLSAGSPFSEEI